MNIDNAVQSKKDVINIVKNNAFFFSVLLRSQKYSNAVKKAVAKNININGYPFGYNQWVSLP